MDMEGNSPSNAPCPLSPNSDQSKKPVGGWKAIKYILGNESFEKLASMSLVANITVYLHTRYNLSGIFLVNVVNIWSGSSNITSIGGAIVSDVYMGRFRTLLGGTILSLLGMGIITLTAGIPELRPPPCHEQADCVDPKKWQLGFLFSSLGLLALGAGAIRPCNIAFGADQFDTNTEKGRAQLNSFFNWWYFSFTIALIIALTVVVYIQTNISWFIGFAIPTVCLALSITIFLIGRQTYICKKPKGSVFVDMVKVVVAAFKKRKINLKSGDQHSFYESTQIGDLSESGMPKLLVKKSFKSLDKASVITDPSELDSQGLPTNTWKLCSIQQVEQFKSLVGIIPVWFSGITCFIVMDQQNTFGILQAIQMDRSLGKHFTIPPAWMGITSMIGLSIWILMYERMYIPTAKKFLKRDSRLTIKQRIQIGIIMSILCMAAAGIVEKKRRESALRNGSFISSLHVLALLPQFVFSGLTEAFAAVAVMELLTTQMSESMRSVAGAMFFLSLSIASYLSSLIVNIIHSVTGGNGKSPWLGGHDLNENRLEYYYFIIAALGFINLIYFIFFACDFVTSVKPTKVEGEQDLENPWHFHATKYVEEEGGQGAVAV